MITLHPEKLCTIPYEDKEDPTISFSMTFKFPFTKDKPAEKDEHPMAYVQRVAKDSIIKTEGIINETTGKEIELNDSTRELLFDFIKTLPDYTFQIAAAMMGPKGKNWLTGVMEYLTTDGHPTNVPPASQSATESVSSLQTNEK